jgi:Dimethyladenosine transferase (rRNA methylation)
LRDKPPVDADPKMFFRVVKASFAQRRKTLGNSLQSGGFSKEAVAAALSAAGIDSQRRGETLSLSEFSDLASHFGR